MLSIILINYEFCVCVYVERSCLWHIRFITELGFGLIPILFKKQFWTESIRGVCEDQLTVVKIQVFFSQS